MYDIILTVPPPTRCAGHLPRKGGGYGGTKLGSPIWGELSPPQAVTEGDIRMSWYIYILRCGDDTLYTGITDDLERRLAVHGTAKGAKYTRGREPLLKGIRILISL